MMLKCIIVDDEPLARKVLEEYASELPDLSLQGQFKNAIEAQQFLLENEVDIAFLDINMPKLTGLELMKQLDNPPLVIFTTAYSEYAVEAFEVNAFDYMVKPISFERFLKAINKCRSFLQKNNRAEFIPNWLTVKEGKRLYKINMPDILYLQAYGDYVRIFTDERSFMTKQRLGSVLAELSEMFIQVHRSYIVNLEKLSYMEGNFVLVHDEKIPVSAGYKDELVSRL